MHVYGLVFPPVVRWERAGRRLLSVHVPPDHLITCHPVTCHLITCHLITCHLITCHPVTCHLITCHVITRRDHVPRGSSAGARWFEATTNQRGRNAALGGV